MNTRVNITYKSWSHMKNRCLNPNATQYKYYQGRGITIYPPWLNYINFLADMGDRPSKDYSIERINNDLGYYPDNCKWGTIEEQSNNKSNTIRLTHNGQTMTIPEWSEHLGINAKTIYTRLHRKWPTHKVLKK